MDIYIEKWSAVFKSALMALALFIISLVISKVIFQPMLRLQTYCESEPVVIVNILKVGGKFVAIDDDEFYYYCYAIPNPELYQKEERVVIEKIEATDIQVKEYDQYFEARSRVGVLEIYSYRYESWWGKFFFDNPRKKRWVFLIPKGTFGKGKIVVPDPVPVYIPIN